MDFETESGQESRELQERVHSLADLHVAKPHLLQHRHTTLHHRPHPPQATPTHLDVLQLEELGYVQVLEYSEDIGDEVVRGVALVPQSLEDHVRLVQLALSAVQQHLLDHEGVWLVTHLHTQRLIMRRLGGVAHHA